MYHSSIDPDTWALPVLVDQEELTSPVQTQDVAWKTTRKQWMIEMDEEGE